jgi:hypothetical protein
MNLKFLGTALAVLAIAGSSAFAHISYSNRNFGTLIISADVSNTTQTVSSGFGWADATDADWGDSHRGRFFRFNLANPLAGDQGVRITVSRNLLGTGANHTFLPAFSLFSGLAQLSPEALAHDSSTLSVNSRPAGTEGSFRSLADWSIGNDDTYNTAGDPTSGVHYASRLAYFTYIGHAADGTSTNFGNVAGIVGDGTADGFVTATFSGLAAGDYSLFVGGATYDIQTSETGPTYPTYGINVTVGLVPEPSASSLLLIAAISGWLRKRKESRS